MALRDIAGVICGFLGVMFAWFPGAGLVLGFTAIILSSFGVRNRTSALAFVGLSLGVFALAVGVAVLALGGYAVLKSIG